MIFFNKIYLGIFLYSLTFGNAISSYYEEERKLSTYQSSHSVKGLIQFYENVNTNKNSKFSENNKNIFDTDLIDYIYKKNINIELEDNIPSLEELFDIESEYGVNIKAAKKRQKFLRKNDLCLNDPATHIVNLDKLIKVSYQESIKKRKNLNLEIDNISHSIREKKKELSKIKNIFKIIKYNKYINKLKEEIKLMKKDVDKLKIEYDSSILYNPGMIISTIIEVIEKIIGLSVSNHIDSKIRTSLGELKDKFSTALLGEEVSIQWNHCSLRINLAERY